MRAFLIALSFIAFVPTVACSAAEGKRPITVQDTIETVRLGDVDYFWGRSPKGRVAQFSLDGKHFVIVLRKGNLRDNTNVYLVYLFDTQAAFHGGNPRPVLKMSSGTNLPAVRSIRWLNDNRTIAFAGETPGGVSQVYTLNTATLRLIQRTRHRTSVDRFDISADGKQILFTAPKEDNPLLTPDERRFGVVIQNQSLADVLSGKFNNSPGEDELFYQRERELKVSVPETHQINMETHVAFSPDGRFATVTANFRHSNTEWNRYKNHTLQFWSSHSAPLGAALPVSQYFLFTASTHSVRTLLDAPALSTSSSIWSKDGQSVILRIFLPLFDVQQGESELPASVSIPNLVVRQISQVEWQGVQPALRKDLPDITLDEDPNSPPRIYANDSTAHRHSLLFDLNPQFSKLQFGHVEELSIPVHGITVVAGLYLPPDYVASTRYPLVVQTHGYDSKRFSMDGRNEWSSGFAARSLAAAGIVVVQMESFQNTTDYDRVANDRTLGKTLEESFRNFSIQCDQEVIRYLDKRGIIDPDKIGISGFSRTVWFSSYALTHGLLKPRTAILTDGIVGGYFDYIARRIAEFDSDNGGKPPFGREGLEQWMKESPGFNLDKVHMPIRLVAMDAPTSLWEWNVAGSLQKSPVEMVVIPDSTHLLERPSDRYIAMQGMVDWFRYWLQDYVDPSPEKEGQFTRWEQFRALESSRRTY